MTGLFNKQIILVALAMAIVSTPFLLSNDDKLAVVAIYFIALTAYLLRRYTHQPERNKTVFVILVGLVATIAWALSRWDSGSFGIISGGVFFVVIVTTRLFT